MDASTNSMIDDVLERAVVSMMEAIEKFPQPNYVSLKVAEEAGEVVQAAVHYAEDRETWKNVEAEVIQMIAMGLRLLVEGDQKNGIIPPHLKS
tara:strand:+ start:484 stop:762 length:279 start_codon:yes stop_codon:yes gene_type:complete